ncbi:MAG TPA: hypothetical protein VGM03_08790 [Phycisphaerae bacterium]
MHARDRRSHRAAHKGRRYTTSAVLCLFGAIYWAPDAAGWTDGPPGAQPTGALTGVTVFCSAGHGWTAGSSSWFLQRPLLLDMNEDYGNLEQLNYFVKYAYQAGATVVPFRPVGYQNSEVVLDNDDPGVTYTGSWTNSTATSEFFENGVTLSGIPYRFTNAAPTETATARYTPNLPQDGFYPIYAWALDGTNRVHETYRVGHSGGMTDVVVDHRLVGKGWVWLGNYHFLAGTSGYVEISNASPDSGVVIADAIRFGNGVGDVVRPGPGTVSGYPREEECARYWAESELSHTTNSSGMIPSNIWDVAGLDDQSDNVGTAARWAAYMNNQMFNNDRWRRVYLEFHSNAAGCANPPCSAQGTEALVTTSPTTNQVAYATILGDEVENDMISLNSLLESPWVPRSNPYNGSFGAISTTNNGNEFDATILEVAFHDNVNDANNLKNMFVRQALARASVQGMIKFLHQLSGSTVPLVFLPEPPQKPRVITSGSNVVVTWAAGPNGGAYGDPPTGYRVYRSSNGYGFDGGTAVGNVLTTTLVDVPAGEITYFRVTAVNAGGESLPSEVLAVRAALANEPQVLIVNGFDRVDRGLDPTYVIPDGPMFRPIERRCNAFDYVVQHAEAMRDLPIAFESVAHEAVIENTVMLSNYETVDWLLGRESETTHTFTSGEQFAIFNYLQNNMGRLFTSGSEIGRDLVGFGGGAVFFTNVLHAAYLGDNAGTSSAVGFTGSILSGVGPFSFSESSGAVYPVNSPDRIGPGASATSVLTYVGGTADSAGIRYNSGVYRDIVLGVPLETVTPAATRDAVMARVLDDLLPVTSPFDADGNGHVDLRDFADFARCFTGSIATLPPFDACRVHDANVDHHIDLLDHAALSSALTGP